LKRAATHFHLEVIVETEMMMKPWQASLDKAPSKAKEEKEEQREKKT
jgi:hypothetical protein